MLNNACKVLTIRSHCDNLPFNTRVSGEETCRENSFPWLIFSVSKWNLNLLLVTFSWRVICNYFSPSFSPLSVLPVSLLPWLLTIFKAKYHSPQRAIMGLLGGCHPEQYREVDVSFKSKGIRPGISIVFFFLFSSFFLGNRYFLSFLSNDSLVRPGLRATPILGPTLCVWSLYLEE